MTSSSHSSFFTQTTLPSSNVTSTKPPTNTSSSSFYDYYDLDTILMEQEALPVTFKMTVPGMGYIEGTHSQTDLREGTTLHLPFWLIESLAIDGLVHPHLPKAFSNASLKSLRASAHSVDLNGLSPYFYLFGEKLMRLSGDDRKIQILSHTLVNTLKERFGWILDFTKTSLEEHSSTFLQGLETTEKE
ncbi:DNA replication protein, partial [Coelomomyces lativittatus]